MLGELQRSVSVLFGNHERERRHNYRISISLFLSLLCLVDMKFIIIVKG